MEVISIINQKGGVGKSTTAHSLGAGLRNKGFKVLFVDLDPQCNLTATLGGIGERFSVLDVLAGNCRIEEAISYTEQGAALLSSPALSLADSTLTEIGKEYKLKEALDKVKGKFDYVIVDTPPALSVLTINALTASNYVIIPALADVYSFHGIFQLEKTIERVKKYCNPELSIKGILLTKYSNRTVMSRDMHEKMKELACGMGTKVFNTTIRESVAIREAQYVGKDIFAYDGKSNAAKDYLSLVNEYLDGDNKAASPEGH